MYSNYSYFQKNLFFSAFANTFNMFMVYIWLSIWCWFHLYLSLNFLCCIYDQQNNGLNSKLKNVTPFECAMVTIHIYIYLIFFSYFTKLSHLFLHRYHTCTPKNQTHKLGSLKKIIEISRFQPTHTSSICHATTAIWCSWMEVVV